MTKEERDKILKEALEEVVLKAPKAWEAVGEALAESLKNRVGFQIYGSEGSPEVAGISVKITYELVDKREIVHTFQMDPRGFQMAQNREVRPIYDTESYRNFGRPVDMAVDPDRKGIQLLIKGVIREGRVWRNWE